MTFKRIPTRLQELLRARSGPPRRHQKLPKQSLKTPGGSRETPDRGENHKDGVAIKPERHATESVRVVTKTTGAERNHSTPAFF